MLVVSPLLSLISDQVSQLQKKGIAAAILSHDREKFGELTVNKDSISTYSLLYTSPETIIGEKWRSIFANKSFFDRLVAIAIDEAHCVSKW